jgi:transcriptional regulator with XRE-family HTH domain
MKQHLKNGVGIRRARELLGLTMEEAAEYLEVSLITLSRWERQLIAPSKVVLRGIEALFVEYEPNKKWRTLKNR